jgi:hypothetical protein
MVGQLIQRSYKYTEAVLESGVVVTTPKVVVEDNKVVIVENANVALSDTQNFSFSVYNYGHNTTYNSSGVPEDVDARAIIKEFIAFVEADIV